MINGHVQNGNLATNTFAESNNPAATLAWQGHFSQFLKTHRKQIRHLLMAINLTYSPLIAAGYGSLAAERGDNQAWQILFGMSSFLQNFPLAFTFFDKLIDFFKKLLFNGTRRFKVSALVGLFLGMTTTIAGIRLSQDAVENSNSDFIRSLGLFEVVLFAFNTFSTRVVGATGLIDNLARCCGYIVERCFSQRAHSRRKKFILSDVSQDVDRMLSRATPCHFNSDDLDLDNPNDLIRAIQRFYQNVSITLPDSRQENSLKRKIWPATKVALGTIIVSCGLLLTSMWLNLTEDGYNALTHKNSHTQNSTGDITLFLFVWIGALSNLFFSFNTGVRFSQTTVTFFVTCMAMINDNVWGYTFSSALFLLITISGYLSGAGIASEVAKYKKNGFGVVAENFRNSPLSVPQRVFEKIINPETAGTLVAGEFINAGCAMQWVTDRIHSNRTKLQELKFAVDDRAQGRVHSLTDEQLLLIEQAMKSLHPLQQHAADIGNENTPLVSNSFALYDDNESAHAMENGRIQLSFV